MFDKWNKASSTHDRRPKLIIQIPCFNEEQTIGKTLAALPRHLDGIGCIEWLIVDDGSTDRTVEVARACGADHVIRIGQNRGLANAFLRGLRASLKRGADIIVNTDADNQYRAEDIPKLVQPILDGRADIVIGARPIRATAHFSPLKKALQVLGSGVVRLVSGTSVEDAPSGFRAITRQAAMRINVFGRYTYTLETIIQAGQRGLSIVSVPIRTNGDLRPSRLVKSITSYVYRSAQTIVRVFMLYRPFRFFAFFGSIPFTAGLLLGCRWLWLNYTDTPISGRIHLPSLILSSILLITGVQIWVLAFVADLMRANRLLLEEVAYSLRARDLEPQHRKLAEHHEVEHA